MRIYMAKFKITAILCAAGICAADYTYAADVGSAFLKIMPSARLQGMGTAGVALSGETQVMYSNPAGLADADIEGLEVSAGHVELVENSRLENVALSHKALGGRMAYGFTYINYGELESRDAAGNLGGSFNASDMALQAGYARQFGKLALGAAMKGVRNKIENESGTGFGFDAGAQLEYGILRFGAALLNAGKSGRVGTQNEDLPMIISGGASAALESIIFSAEARRNIPEKRTVLSGGLEAALLKALYLRGGYSRDITTKSAENTDNIKGVCAGFGVKMGQYRIDYAYLSQGELGSNQRFTLTAKF
jgi:hypothetical protein